MRLVVGVRGARKIVDVIGQDLSAQGWAYLAGDEALTECIETFGPHMLSANLTLADTTRHAALAPENCLDPQFQFFLVCAIIRALKETTYADLSLIDKARKLSLNMPFVFGVWKLYRESIDGNWSSQATLRRLRQVPHTTSVIVNINSVLVDQALKDRGAIMIDIGQPATCAQDNPLLLGCALTAADLSFDPAMGAETIAQSIKQALRL